MKTRLFLFSSGTSARVTCKHCGWTSRGRGAAQKVFDRSNAHDCAGVESYAAMLLRLAADDAEAQPEPQYLLWSQHHKAWWGPGGSGYRSNPADAGRYALADTEQWLGRGCYCCKVPEVPIPAEKVVGATDRSIRGVIVAATQAAIKAGKGNRHYCAAEAVAR